MRASLLIWLLAAALAIGVALAAATMIRSAFSGLGL